LGIFLHWKATGFGSFSMHCTFDVIYKPPHYVIQFGVTHLISFVEFETSDDLISNKNREILVRDLVSARFTLIKIIFKTAWG